MSAEVTPWFNGTIKPARPGVYERDYGASGAPWFAEWTGVQWLSPASTPRRASKQVTAAFTQWGIPWRGLAQEPKV